MAGCSVGIKSGALVNVKKVSPGVLNEWTHVTSWHPVNTINYTDQFLQIPGFIHWSLFVFTKAFRPRWIHNCERWMNPGICKNWSVWWFYPKLQIPLLVFCTSCSDIWTSAKSENTNSHRIIKVQFNSNPLFSIFYERLNLLQILWRSIQKYFQTWGV